MLKKSGCIARPGTEIQYRVADVQISTNNVGNGPIGIYAGVTYIAVKRKSFHDVVEGRLYALGVYFCHPATIRIGHSSALFIIVRHRRLLR